ncbi:MAG TPA: cystathionine gamma-synthase [Longimicrobiales bacterium]|nr:cystathionine gamma-synthase [Longimicrobiales bacterium]
MKIDDSRTCAVRAGIESDPHHGAVVPPIHLSANFSFAGFDGKREYDYTRSGNPTRDHLAAAIAELEGAYGGVVTASGMAAVTLVVQLLRPGDLLLAPHDCYGGTHRLLRALASRGNFDVECVDMTAADGPAKVRSRQPRLLWIETPSNPLLRIADIAALAEAGHDCGTVVVADNTFLSPALQRPIDLGADIVLHSTTKYLNGHSDVVGGAVVAREAAVLDELSWWANCLGLAGAPFDAYLTLRGLRTLHARMAVHLENAAAVADALTRSDAVTHVYYPGLPTHEGHDVAARQQLGAGAMMSFELAGGEPAVRALLDGLRCFTLAESLGGVESLIAHPATMTHASMDAAARDTAGITDSLLRLSVGIESTRDLLRDLGDGLDRAQSVARISRTPLLAAL